MPLIEDHHYLKICAQLASSLSISIAAARRKVEVAAAKEGKKDLQSRKELAQKILDQVLDEDKKESHSAAASFDELLKALKEEENFMIEDKSIFRLQNLVIKNICKSPSIKLGKNWYALKAFFSQSPSVFTFQHLFKFLFCS